MSSILTPGQRPDAATILGDHQRRIQRLEAAAPECCIPTAASLSALILADPCLTGFWKLDETTGDTAEDSSSGGHNMVSGAGDPPTWEAAVTPFAENAAGFGTGLIEEATSFPALTGDFTLEMWAKRTTSSGGVGTMFTQGDPVPANHTGVLMAWIPSSSSNQIVGYVGDTTGGPHVVGTGGASFATAAWHYVVLVRSSNVWSIYVDAVQNGASYNDGGTNYNSTTGLAIGNKQGTLASDYFPGYLSYGATYSCALTLAQIEERYALGSAGGGIPDGWVLTADSSNADGWSWQPPTIEVQF